MISWEPYLHIHSRNPFEDKVEVKSVNTEVFESCKLKTYQRNKTIKDWQETKKATVLLEMEIAFAKAVNSDKVKSVLANKGDVQNKMVFEDSKWKTSWDVSIEKDCRYCGHEQSYRQRCAIEILIELNFNLVDEENSIKKKNDLLQLWKKQIPTDVTVQLEEHLFEAHTFILAAGSPVFAAMLQHDFEETS